MPVRSGVAPRVLVGAAVWVGLTIVHVLAAVWPVINPLRLLVIAHQGDVEAAPENSLEAIQAAARSSADGIVFDVNRSADGTWRVTHDDELSARTTGSGSPWAMTDSEMTRLRLDGGMGYDAAADTNRFAVPRLMTVLHALVGYDGILIIACRDTQPLAHETLARELAARGLFPWIIVRHLAGASEVKHVDPRFQTLILDSYTWHPDVDAWAASADRGFHPPLTSWADLHGSVGAFVDEVLARRSSDAPERTPLGRVVRDQ